MPIKIIKAMEIILIVILSLVLLAVTLGAYLNLQSVRASTNDLDKSINEVMAQWIKSDSETTEMLIESRKKLEEAEIRIDKLIKEAGIDE
jgi:predicted Holliday junction resolvase-like endonuclease